MQNQLLQVHLIQRLKEDTTTKILLKHCYEDAATKQENEQENFGALVQYRVEELTNDYTDMDMELKSLFLDLRRKTTVENLNLILSNNEFQNIFRKVLNNSYGI